MVTSGKADKATGPNASSPKLVVSNKGKQKQDYFQGKIGLFQKKGKLVLFLPKKKNYFQDGEIRLFCGRNSTALNSYFKAILFLQSYLFLVLKRIPISTSPISFSPISPSTEIWFEISG